MEWAVWSCASGSARTFLLRTFLLRLGLSLSGQVAKEMCLWALKSGSPVFHSQLYYLLEVCLCPVPVPALQGAGSFIAFKAHQSPSPRRTTQLRGPLPPLVTITSFTFCSVLVFFHLFLVSPSASFTCIKFQVAAQTGSG